MALEVAKTILEQLGGNKFAAMTGAKNFIGSEHGLSFRLGRNKSGANFVSIVLNGLDLYDITFTRVRNHVGTKVAGVENVYNDMLQVVFTSVTGLDTHL